MRSNVPKFVVILAIVSVAMVVALGVVRRPEAWPPVEEPARQGEALDRSAYSEGRYVHSGTALSRLIREPFNTWTNFAFVVVGAWFIVSHRPISSQAGLALVSVGVGSFLYHASASRTLRHLDVGAMYWIYAYLIFLGFGAIFSALSRSFTSRARLWGVVLPAMAILAAVFRNVRVAGWKPLDLSLITGVCACVAGLGMVVAARKTSRWGSAITGLLVFGLAVACQIGDRPGHWLCNPGSMVQAHGMWHILGAIACGLAIHLLSNAWEDAPNKSLQPTSPAVTPRAGARVAPAGDVAEH